MPYAEAVGRQLRVPRQYRRIQYFSTQGLRNGWRESPVSRQRLGNGRKRNEDRRDGGKRRRVPIANCRDLDRRGARNVPVQGYIKDVGQLRQSLPAEPLSCCCLYDALHEGGDRLGSSEWGDYRREHQERNVRQAE